MREAFSIVHIAPRGLFAFLAEGTTGPNRARGASTAARVRRDRPKLSRLEGSFGLTPAEGETAATFFCDPPRSGVRAGDAGGRQDDAIGGCLASTGSERFWSADQHAGRGIVNTS